MEDIAAVEAKLTQVPLYSILYKELLSSTLTGGNQRQAPRIPTVMPLLSCIVPDIDIFASSTGKFNINTQDHIAFALCLPWRLVNEKHMRIVSAMERFVATTGHFFEVMMATCHHLGIALGLHSELQSCFVLKSSLRM